MNFKIVLTNFKIDGTVSELELTLSHKERRLAHELCETMGLYSLSSGPQNNGILIVSKTPVICEFEINDEE